LAALAFLAACYVFEYVLDKWKTWRKTYDLRLGVVSLASFNLSSRSKSSQESIILIFLDLFLGQGTAPSFSGFGLLSSNLMRTDVSIPLTLIETLQVT
jgi:hypothetical protein